MHDHVRQSSTIGFGHLTFISPLPDFLLPHNSGEVESGDATPSGQSLQDLQAQKAAAEEKAAAMRDEMVAFKRRVADAEAKSRSDRKVRPINRACSCELDMLPQVRCQETQYVPQASADLPFCSALLCSDAVDVVYVFLIDLQLNHSETQLCVRLALQLHAV